MSIFSLQVNENFSFGEQKSPENLQKNEAIIFNVPLYQIMAREY